MSDDLKVDPAKCADMQLVVAHRLGKPRHSQTNADSTLGPRPPAIIVVFVKSSDRDLILHSHDKLAGSPRSIRTDLPPQLKIKRGKLAATAFKLRKERGLQTRIRVVDIDVVLEICEMTVVLSNLSLFIMKLLLSILVSSTAANVFAENVTTVLDQLLEGYDNRLRPGFGGSPVVVRVDLNIRSMGPISESDMRMSMQCYLRQSWKDERLTFDIPGNETVRLALNIKMLEKIWHPDTVILNGQHSYLHTVPMPNKLFRIDPNGSILFSQRLTIRTRCMMRLEKFPLDSQDCPMYIGSFGYSDDDILYEWKYGKEKAAEIAKDMTLSQFDLISYPGSNGSALYRDTLHSTLKINFHLKRRMGYFLIQVYLPCCLLVVLSWVSFWINREATADRIMLGVTTVLTMTFFGIDNRTDLPKVSYSTALDIYIGMCFTFVMATVIQFAIVHYFTKVGSGEHDDLSNDGESEEETPEKTDDRGFRRTANGRSRIADYGFPESRNNYFLSSPPRGFWDCLTRREDGRRRFHSSFFSSLSPKTKTDKSANISGMNSVSKIDKAARIMFPLAFVAFNIAYWALYSDL